MNWQEISAIVGGVIVSVGGAGAIIVAVSKWFGNIIANRVVQKNQAKYDKELEALKTDAVNAIADVFAGQPYQAQNKYTLDKGIVKQKQQLSIYDSGIMEQSEDYDMGFANARIELSDEQLLANIKNIQSLANIKESQSLSHKFGAVDLDVEMETGTGKTYVYIKTMFELNKRYGFSIKYIYI